MSVALSGHSAIDDVRAHSLRRQLVSEWRATMLFPISALDAPIRVEFVDIYSDGTIWFVLTDSLSRSAHVCIDGRKLSPTRNRLFDRARHPGKPGAVLLQLGGIEEAIVVPLLSRWLDSGPPHALGLNEYGWELIRDALSRLGEPSL